MKTKNFKSIPSVTTITTIEQLTYGIGKENNSWFIFLKKPRQQWVKQTEHGPFGNPAYAESYIKQIEDEYHAVRAKAEARARSQTKAPYLRDRQ